MIIWKVQNEIFLMMVQIHEQNGIHIFIIYFTQAAKKGNYNNNNNNNNNDIIIIHNT